MNIAKSKNQKKKRKKQLSVEEKFQREWQRVQNLQRSNANLQRKMADFAQQVSKQIEDKEQLFCTVRAAQTERLIQFIPKKTLAEYQRQQLIFWIQSNIEEIASNPFSNHKDITYLSELLVDNFESHEKNQFEKWEKKYDNMDEGDDAHIDNTASKKDHSKKSASYTEDQHVENMDMFEELFADFEDDDQDENIDEFFQEFFEEEFSHFDELTQKQQEEENALSKLLKSTSINKLFRRVAKALHPDLEQNEIAKEEKHKLMAELIEARENKDITKIIDMYTKYIGEAPLELFNGDYEKMTILLKHQIERLQEEKQNIIEENSNEAIIYQRFHRSSEAKTKNEIRQHIKNLDEQIDSTRELTHELTSLKKIKPILQQISTSYNFFDLADELFDESFEDFRF